MPTNNDAQAYIETEEVVPDGATGWTSGYLVAYQATRLGVTVVVSESTALNGTYTLVVETGVADDLVGVKWNTLQFCTVTFDTTGVYELTVVQPIYDKIRLRWETDATNPEHATLGVNWMCDTELTLIEEP